MNFLFPSAFFLSVAAPVVIAFYLRRPRRRQIEVSTLLFWRKILEREPHRRFLGKLRNPLSLLLQLLILMLLILAVARPDFGLSGGRKSVVVVLDTRARMQAGGGAVWEKAIAAARSAVSQAGPGAEVALLAADHRPRILSSFSDDGRQLRAALDRGTPSDGGGDLNETLALAENLLAGKPAPRKVLLISDRAVPDRAGVEQILVGKAEENLAILSLAQRPLPDSPQSVEIFARLANFSARTQDAEMELLLDGKPIDLQKLHFEPGGNQTYKTVIPAESLQRGQGLLVARLTKTDGLAVDDEARAALPVQAQLRVLLVTDDDPFLESALKADPSVNVSLLKPEYWQSGMGAGFDAVIFDDWLPDGATLESLGNGSFFFFGRPPFGSQKAEPTIEPIDVSNEQSPLLRNLQLGTLRITKARLLTPPADPKWRVEEPLRAGAQPLLMTLERPGGRRIVATAFPLEDSNFPLRAGFPLFVSNTVHWLGGREENPDASRRAGETYFPKAGEQISARAGGQSAAPDQAPPLVETPLPLRKDGFYEVRKTPSAGQPAEMRWIAVNTADAEESDLRQSKDNHSFLALGSRWAALQPWQWIALLALAMILAEWALHHRRVTE